MILEILLDIFFALLIVTCVLWVVVGIYSTRKERLHEERLNNLLEKEKYIQGEKSMTCREKLKLEHPDYISSVYAGGYKGCPGEYGYIIGATAGGPKCMYNMKSDSHHNYPYYKCVECWNRPVENMDDKKSIDDVAREVIQGAYGNGFERIRKLMDAGYDPHAVQCRVNELMIEEMDKFHAEDSVNRYKECATEMHALYTAFTEAGFNPDRAFKLTNTMLAAAIHNDKE